MIDKPNILLIITDHQAFHAHNRPGEFTYTWPRFEGFCSVGTRFERAYTVCPLCTPARASMMTGVYPGRHGMVRNTDGGGQKDFRPGQLLYSHHLARAGYRNAYVGKWHCGHTRLPVDYGIEGWSLPDYGRVYMSEAYKAYAKARGLGEARARIEYNLDHPEWEGQTLTLHHESPWHFMNGSGVLEGPAEAHEEQFVAHLAIEKLKELEAGGQPWSLVASFWGPHQPFYPSEPFASMVEPSSIPEYPSFRDDLSGRPLRHYLHRDRHHAGARRWTDWSIWQRILARAYGQGLQTDAAIGMVLDALDDLAATDNTIVIWCADHGDALASHGGLWDKASTFTEEVARVPLAIQWPARIEAGSVREQLLSNMDVTATMLDAAGVAVPDDIDSRSLLPLCEVPGAAEWPDELVCEHNGHGEDILQRIVYRGCYKYVAALYDGDELYDLSEDPYEMHNLIDSPGLATVRDDLRDRIVRHIAGYEDRDHPAFQRAERLKYSLETGF